MDIILFNAYTVERVRPLLLLWRFHFAKTKPSLVITLRSRAVKRSCLSRCLPTLCGPACRETWT